MAKRFTDDEANRVTYVQFVRHTSLVKDDPALFAQSNAGVELYAGNRNWTILAGGVPVAPGEPGPPPEVTAIASPIIGRRRRRCIGWCDDRSGFGRAYTC